MASQYFFLRRYQADSPSSCSHAGPMGPCGLAVSPLAPTLHSRPPKVGCLLAASRALGPQGPQGLQGPRAPWPHGPMGPMAPWAPWPHGPHGLCVFFTQIYKASTQLVCLSHRYIGLQHSLCVSQHRNTSKNHAKKRQNHAQNYPKIKQVLFLVTYFAPARQ